MSAQHHHDMRRRLNMALTAINDGDVDEARRQIAAAWELHNRWPDTHSLYEALHVAIDEHERRDGDPQTLADLVALEGEPDFADALRSSGWEEPSGDPLPRGASWTERQARDFVRLTRRLADRRLIMVSARPIRDESPVVGRIFYGTEVQITAADVEEILERRRARRGGR